MRLAGTTKTLLAGLTALAAVVFTTIFMILAPTASAQAPDEGADIYGQSCARCHMDDGSGIPNRYPPIAGNPDAADLAHVVDVVTNGLSGKVIMGVEYDRDMPAFKDRLTPDEIQMVSEYTVQLAEAGPGTTPSTTAPTVEGAESIGDALFGGSTLLANGGVSCVACHTAGKYNALGGSALASDLGGIVEAFGTAGFVDAITDPVVAEMIVVFGDHPITDQEANDLAAFLATTTAQESEGSSLDLLQLLGFVGFLVLILITALVLRGPQETYESKLRSNR